MPTIADGALAPALAGIDGLSPLLTLDAPAPSILASADGPRLGRLGDVGDTLAPPIPFRTPPAPGAPGTPGVGGGIPTVSNAPEPTSWLLMIGGFGVLGGAMRYVRKANVTA